MRRRFSIPAKVQAGIGYGIVGTAVVLSWFMTPIPVAVGFTLLAGFRVGFMLRENRRNPVGEESEASCSVR